MTYSSFDPSKVQIDSASNLGNLTDRINQEEIAEAQKPAPQPELDEEQQKKAAEEYEKEKAAMPTWRRSLEEGRPDPDLIAESDMTLEQKAQARLDEFRAAKRSMQPSQYGLSENTIELFDAIKGGAAKTWSSIMTLPERVVDMSTGAMQREIEETGRYRPEFDPLALSDYDPGLKTWWGKLMEMGIHFTGLAGGVKSIPGVGSKVAGGGVAADIGVGFASDIVSSTSQEGNLSQEIFESKVVERVPYMGEFLNRGIGFLATKDSDHPWLKTFKNAFEGIAADVLVGSVLRKFEGGEALDAERKSDITRQVDEAIEAESQADAVKYAEDSSIIQSARERLQQIKQQISDFVTGDDDRAILDELNAQFDAMSKQVDEMSKSLEIGNFSAYTNRDMADPWQGAPSSRAKSAFDGAEQAKRMNDQWDTPGAGSTDSMFTPVQAYRMATESGMTEAELDRLAKELLTDSRYQEMKAEVAKNKMTFKEVYGYAFERMQETIGRDATSTDPEDFWKPFLDDVQDRFGGTEAWSMKNVVAADLVNASLFSQLRDLGIASREIFDIADVMDTDGPMKTIAERLIVGLTNVKRSRYLISTEFRKLQGPKAQAALNERVEGFRAESEAAVNMFMEMAQNSDSDAVAKALVEAFSMSNKIQNWKDLDAYMKQRIRNFGLQDDAGIVIKELQGVMMHSILSGPKTALRAMSGTFTASVLRPMNTAVGASMRGDWDTARANMASMNAFMQTIPEAWKLFKTNLGSYWAGDVATVKTRFAEARTKADDQWALYENWVDTRGSDADKAAFAVANMARSLNDNKFLTYSTSIMGATDDAFTMLMARARSREKALRQAMDEGKAGNVSEVTPELLRKYEDNFYKDLLDADGNINIESDLYLKSTVKEATLTQDLSGFTAGLEGLFNSYPFAKPFFLFARTGINGLMLSYKSMPGLGLLHKQSVDILRAKPEDLDSVLKYGIDNPEDLANAQALIAGRQAIGGSIVTMAGMHYMNGGLTGNGPQDRQLRKLWMDTGWQPRSIKVGNVWVSYDTFEPFNTVLAAIADIGDNMKLMGPQWTEQNLMTVALAVAGTATSKSYLQGLGQFVDLFSGESKQHEKIIGGLINNTVPLASLRNEIGKMINPHMREINGSLIESIRNRNLLTEFGDDALAVKYDILNGKPIRDWNFMERMWNSLSPISLQMIDSPGRTMLWNSNYDLRLVSYSSPDNVDLSEYPQMRSWFQEELGKLNLEKTLDELAGREDVKASIKLMQDDVRNGKQDLDPMKAYVHNRLIRDRFERARKKAWAKVRENHPDETNVLYEERAQKRVDLYQKLRESKGQLMPNI
jgi:hypothetical protein